jgi:squalene-hopene/tetraprenyl-beta-curcumene cyclase
MQRHFRPAVLALGLVLLTTPPPGKARGGDPGPPPWSPKAAAEYLDGRADWWLKWSGAARGQGTACLSCHTSMPFALARPALGARLGETSAGLAETRLIDGLKKRVQNWEKIVAQAAPGKDPFIPFYPRGRKPSALGTEAVLNALVLVNHDVRRAKGALSEVTRKALAHLWGQQQENGAWLWLDFGLNPWEHNGAYYGAALAAVAVGTAGKDHYEQAELQPKVAALKKYLQTQSRGQPLHHRAVGLWAASRLPGVLAEADRKQLIEELLSAQEADGGWSLPKLGKSASGKGGWESRGAYPERAASDGYATGLVVLALKRAGVAADDPRLKKGIGWLVSKQQEGAWPVHYLNRRRDPQDNIGKFMRDAATAFAILALTEPTAPDLGSADGRTKQGGPRQSRPELLTLSPLPRQPPGLRGQFTAGLTRAVGWPCRAPSHQSRCPCSRRNSPSSMLWKRTRSPVRSGK